VFTWQQASSYTSPWHWRLTFIYCSISLLSIR
jgi:hypothetical protein